MTAGALGLMGWPLTGPSPGGTAGAGRPLLEKQWPWWAEILAHPPATVLAGPAVADRFEDITVPALNIGGWFDIFVQHRADFTRDEEAGRQRRGP